MPERRLHRVTWFCLGLCLSFYTPFSSQAQSPQRSSKPPNIVLILADDVGREALGCYGGTSYPTPRLDQLASEGMRLTHFFAAPVCHPTRVALISGRYLPHAEPQVGLLSKGRPETRDLATRPQACGLRHSSGWQVAPGHVKRRPPPPFPHGVG